MTPESDTGLLRDLIYAFDAKMTERLDRQDRKLDAIHLEARATNGRVSGLERRESNRSTFWVGLRGGFKWVLGTLIAVGGVSSPLWLPLFS